MQNDQYTQAHLFVAAIRIISHQKDAPPTVEEVADMLNISLEQCHRLCRRLCDKGIVRHMQTAFDNALYVQDHLQIEELPKNVESNTLAADIERFKSKQPNIDDKIKAFKAEQEQKRLNLFADLKKEFKDKLKDTEDD